MKRTALALFLLAASSISAQSTSAPPPAVRVADDAKVIGRVAEASKRDLPGDLLKRILDEDLDLLRGKRADGSYQWASFERLEAGRKSEDFSIKPRKENELSTIEMRGSWVYRLIVSVPSRRIVVAKNRRVWVERVDVEYIAENSSATRVESYKVEEWMEPGATKTVDFPAVARQATVRVVARADQEAGYGNVVLSLVQAKVVDRADSPYADAVASARAIVRAIDNGDVPSIRAMAARMVSALGGGTPSVAATPGAGSAMTVTATPETTGDPELYRELQAIEDLLTGSETERREGLDKLHQLVRRLRP